MSNILVSLNISEAGDSVSLLVGRFQVLEIPDEEEAGVLDVGVAS